MMKVLDRSVMLDFSGGINGSRSEYGSRVRHVRYADNVIFRPRRGMSCRSGSRRITDTQFVNAHSAGVWKDSAGASKAFVAMSGAPGTIKDALANVAQTIPAGLTNELLTFDQLNGNLWAAPQGGAVVPFFYGPSTGANTFLTAKLPVPGAMTLAAATTAGPPVGRLTALAVYFYRLRWRHRDGSGKAGTPQQVTLVGANNSVNITVIPLGARADYLGWTLERAINVAPAGAPVKAGGYYRVASGTAANYLDIIGDDELRELSDDGIHGEPDHYDGIISHADRLWGWRGGVLYYSNARIDLEDTGLCNWDAQSNVPFGKDDGDPIKTVVRALDRLVVIKGNSTWVLEGGTPEEFRAYRIADVGAGGLRSAWSDGGNVYFYGDRGYYVAQGNEVKPFGWEQMGHYFDRVAANTTGTTVMRSWRGQFMLLWVTTALSGTNGETIVYDLRFGNWAHFTGWQALDAVETIGSSFSGASMIFVGSDGYLYSAFDGASDKRVAAGTGGVPIPWMFETPPIDDGDPDVFKDYGRQEHYLQSLSGTVALAVAFITDDETYAATIPVTGAGSIWGGPNWGSFVWGAAGDAFATEGLPEGILARRYTLRVSALLTAGITYSGYVIDFRRRRERRFS